MKLYDYAPSQNAYKVRMLLQHLDITWETVQIAIFRGESRSVNFLDRNPAGAVPVLEPEPGRYIAESNAILCYLAEGTRFFASDPFRRARSSNGCFSSRITCNPLSPRFATGG
jgi:glutathione S-transferase